MTLRANKTKPNSKWLKKNLLSVFKTDFHLNRYHSLSGVISGQTDGNELKSCYSIFVRNTREKKLLKAGYEQNDIDSNLATSQLS
jgi:hypothetical protein